MTERLSMAQFRALQKKGSKYSAQKTEAGGIRFDSKLEADRFDYWNKLWQAKAIHYVLRQVPFYLPGGITYRLDFLILHLDGRISYEDTKGVLTRVSANKIKQVEEIYRITIELIGKPKKGRVAHAKPGARG